MFMRSLGPNMSSSRSWHGIRTAEVLCEAVAFLAGQWLRASVVLGCSGDSVSRPSSGPYRTLLWLVMEASEGY